MTASRAILVAAYVLIVVGLALLSWVGIVRTEATHERAIRESALPVIEKVEEAPVHGDTLGLLVVPRLDLSTVVIEGDDESSLMVGAGHLSDTPLPWDKGNSVLAGHRDTDFRPLRRIRAGDAIQFRTADTTIEYIVRETLIVEPTDLSVLQASNRSMLTLITCYPFSYIGPAPKRFVVRAERSLDQQTQSGSREPHNQEPEG